MKNILFISLLFSSFLQAQHVLSNRLQASISDAEHIYQKFAIRIQMQDKVDAFQLHQDYILKQTPLKKEQLKLLKDLKQSQNKSKKSIKLFKI